MLTSDEIRAIFRQHGAQDILSICEPTLAAFDDIAIPNPGQTAAIAFHTPKIAALCFDRVWAGAKPDIPKSIAFRTASSLETGLIFLTALLLRLNEAADHGHDVDKYVALVGNAVLDLLPDVEFAEIPSIDQYSKIISDAIGQEYALAVVPVYSSSAQRDFEYRAGERSAVVAILENVPVISEADLEWEQVLEIRRDIVMLQKLRKFTHWLDSDMIGRPLSFIEDEVAVRFDGFREASRAHGIATTLGVLQLTLETPALFGGTAYLAKLGAAASQEWALIAGAAMATAAVSVHIAQRMLNIRTQRATAAGEIAYVVELQERVRPD